MQRALAQAPFQRVIKQRLLNISQRTVHNASNPHQSKQQHQIQTQPTPSQNSSEIEATPSLTNILSNGQDLIKYTHNHIRTQRFSPTDRMHTQLFHFDQLKHNNLNAEARFPSITQRYQQTQPQHTQQYTAAQTEKSYSL